MKQFRLLWIAVLLMSTSNHALAAKKTIGILVFDGVLSSDVTSPLEVFGVASKLSWFSSYKVKTIGMSKKNFITTEEGLKLGVDTSIEQNPKVDVLIIPSRYEMESLINNQQLIKFIKDHAKTVEWIASNCSGSSLLAEANVLDNRKATTWAGGEQAFQQKYPKVKVQFDTNVVVDDNVITSNGSLVSYQSALTLLRLMTSSTKAKEVAEALQFSRVSNQIY